MWYPSAAIVCVSSSSSPPFSAAPRRVPPARLGARTSLISKQFADPSFHHQIMTASSELQCLVSQATGLELTSALRRAVYGDVNRARIKPGSLGMCGVCRRDMKLGDAGDGPGKKNSAWEGREVIGAMTS